MSDEMQTIRKICRVIDGAVVGRSMPKEVRAGPIIWERAEKEMRNNPRVRELYGVPLCARIDEPNFMLRGIPVILDASLLPEEVRA